MNALMQLGELDFKELQEAGGVGAKRRPLCRGNGAFAFAHTKRREDDRGALGTCVAVGACALDKLVLDNEDLRAVACAVGYAGNGTTNGLFDLGQDAAAVEMVLSRHTD